VVIYGLFANGFSSYPVHPKHSHRVINEPLLAKHLLFQNSVPPERLPSSLAEVRYRCPLFARPAVRSASLLEQRGFEPPVLFGLFRLRKEAEAQPLSARICQQIARRIILWSALAQWPSLKPPGFVSVRNHKEDRQFESPLLQQRGTANHRSVSRLLLAVARRQRSVCKGRFRRLIH